MNNKKESFFRWGNKNFLALVIGAVSLAVYLNTIPNSLNIDDELIYENHVLKGNDFSTLKKIFTEPYYKDAAGNKYEYRPMVLLAYFVEFRMFGQNPHVSHAVNVMIFSGTCVLLFYLLMSLFGNSGVSFSVSLLFAVHTIHTEAVASIKNRDELLSLLFALSAWMYALRFADSKKPVPYLLFLLFFIAGLFSKQSIITYAILIPASIILFRKISLQQLLMLIIPLVLASVIFSPVYLLVKKVMLFVAELLFLVFFYYAVQERERFIVSIKKIPSVFTTKTVTGKRKLGYALASFAIIIIIGSGIFLMKSGKPLPETLKQAEWNIKDGIHDLYELKITPALNTPAPAIIPIAGRKLNFVEVPLLYTDKASTKIATSIYVMGEYLRLMFVPYPLGFYYGYNQIPLVSFSNIRVLFYLALYAALLGLMVYLLTTRKHLIVAFGLLYYLISILPLSNLLTPIAGIMAERLAYAPSLGFCMVLGYLLAYPASSIGVQIKMVRIIFISVVTLYALATITRNFNWKDRLTLMRHDIKYLENSARANHLLATHLAHQASAKRQLDLPENKQMLNEAVVHFKKAVEIYPEFPYAWYDLAKTYVFLKNPADAIKAYSRSTHIDTSFSPAWFELGVVLGETGSPAEAENAYRQAIRRDSSLMEAYINLSYLYYQQGKYNEALELTQRAIRYHPEAYALYVNMGRIYNKMQDTSNALVYLEKAFSINRSDKKVRDMIASLYRSLGNNERAEYYGNLR